MHLPALISDLAIMLLTGGVVTILFKKINQPLVLGYIVAGFLIGPFMPLFFTVGEQAAIDVWSEIGIIILMFSLGLEFNLHKLTEVGGTAIVTALTEVAGMLLVGFFVGQAMGWGTMDSVFLGGMLSMSSTTIIIKSFDELGVRKESFATLVFGTLVIEDIAGIFMMIVLSTVSVSQSISGGELALKLGLLVLYLALWLLLGIYLLPTLLKKAASLMNDETLLIVSLGICFGMVLLADALGFSSALGAFLAGSLLAGTVHAERIEHLTGSVKDLFGAVFFMSVGMMLDPALVVKYIVPILIVTVVTIVGKLFMSSVGVLLSGQKLRNAIHCGCSLAQIGEFAFIIASLGQSLGVIGDYVYPIIISVSFLTTITTPFFIKSADKVYDITVKLLPGAFVKRLERYTDGESEAGKSRDSDWAAFLKRWAKNTVLYGVLMFGATLLGRYAVLPLLEKLPIGETLCRMVAMIVTYAGMLLFIRPMLDTRSPAYTLLWVEKKAFRLPLLGLNGLRILLAVLLMFLPLRMIAGLNTLWALPILAAAVIVLSRLRFLDSAYFQVEARFLANLNERQLRSFEADGAVTEWLDERLCVLRFPYPEGAADGEALSRLGWGRRYGVNVMQVIRGRRHHNMPSGSFALHRGDMVCVIGERENLRSFRLGMQLPAEETLPTLREFIQAEEDGENALYSYAVPVEKGSPLAGSSIRESGLREHYDCMIVGLQRSGLPISQPDVNMRMMPGDLVWCLGSRSMAGKLLKDIELTES